MPVVPCPHCTNPVTLPPTWGGAAYTCPHCRRVAGGSPPPPPRPVAPPPVPVPPPPPSLSFGDDNNYDNPSPPRRRPPTGSPVVDFLTFRLMITPILIQVVFWVGTAACVLSGGSMVLSSFANSSSEKKSTSDSNDVDNPSGKAGVKNAKTSSVSSGFNSWSFISGVTIVVFGPFLIRLYCELMIIIFKIHDELKTANDRRGRT